MVTDATTDNMLGRAPAARRVIRMVSLLVVAALAGCATTRAPHGAGSHSPAPTGETQDHSSAIYERGDAGYYAARFDGRTTASGETYDPHELTAAHRTLPLGTRVRVIDLDNHKHVTVRINDRGPFVSGRVIDLSNAAARKLKMRHDGVVPVTLQIVSEPH